MRWNFDIGAAPRGKMVETTTDTPKGTRKSIRFVPDKLIVATKCGKVTVSEFIPDENRWLMLHRGEQPDAWLPWPTHPRSAEHRASKESEKAA